MTIDFDRLRHEVWPMGPEGAQDGDAQLYEYALGGLELSSSQLERNAILAHKRSKLLLDIALHPEKYDF